MLSDSGGREAALRIAIVGNAGATNVGESLRRAARSIDHSVQFFDAGKAVGGTRLLRALSWHLADHRPLRLNRVAAEVVAACTLDRPDVLIATGAAPLTQKALLQLRYLNIPCINYSTDDPWNRTQLANWHLKALPAYSSVFTPRQSNIKQIRSLGCFNVNYLPFGYDDELFSRPTEPAQELSRDVLFVGGADRDRVSFMTEFMNLGPDVALVGSYWERFAATRPHALGHKPPDALRTMTAGAKVNLCLVRRANRDGHVMRSFEIAAVGGCMLAEDTEEHRTIFGADGECVYYFRTPRDAAHRALTLIANPTERSRLATAAHKRIVSGKHTYRDRLSTMLRVGMGQIGQLELKT